jgi:hypothetical protein
MTILSTLTVLIELYVVGIALVASRELTRFCALVEELMKKEMVLAAIKPYPPISEAMLV